MELSLKQNQLGAKKVKFLKLEIDPKSHLLDRWKTKLMDKGRISKFNKKFQNFKSEKKKTNVKYSVNANGNCCLVS